MGYIVEFPLQLPEADVFEHEDMARLYAAWRQIVRAGASPLLRDFAPRLLGRWMAWSAIAETAATSPEALAEGGVMRWRLAGSALCRLAGMELTRQTIFDGWQRFERATLERLLGQTLFRQQAFLARLKLAAAGMNDARLEMLVLPLHDAACGRDVALVVFRPHFEADMVMASTLHTARLMSLRTLEAGMAQAQEPVQAQAGAQEEEMAPMAKVLPLFGPQPVNA